MLRKLFTHAYGFVPRAVQRSSAHGVRSSRTWIAMPSPELCLSSRPFSAIAAPIDTEVAKWLDSATTGDSESAFQLGVLLHRREEARARSAPTAQAEEGKAAAAQVLKEIKEEKLAARKAKKERFQLPKAAAVVTVTSSKDTWQYWIRKAARTGHSTALVYLGNQLLHGKVDALSNESENIAEAAACYEKAATADPPHVDALFNLGTLYFSGAEDSKGAKVIPADVGRSFEYFSEAAARGDVGAQYWVGHCLLSGEGGAHAVNVHQGIDLLKKAAEKAHPAALYYLATVYRSGLAADTAGLAVPADRKSFLTYLEMAVAANEADALFCMADLYLQGLEGYPLDERKALFYLELAAELQHADAITSLGAMHYSGRGGLPADKRRAFELYNQAGELGSQQAWRNLASMHFTGDGVPQSEEIAREILKHLKD